MSSPRIPAPSPRRTLAPRGLLRAWLHMLLLALVLAPALGRMHQIVHGLGPGGAPAAHGHAAAPGASQALDTLHALFAGHGSADCQVLDQHTLGGGAPAQALALPQAAPQGQPACEPAAAPAAGQAAPFQARAPPRLA